MIHLPETKDQFARQLLREAYVFANENSDDIHTQVGVIIADPYGHLMSQGANRFADGVSVNQDRLQRPQKYLFLEHAERDALVSFYPDIRATMYGPWAACADCARCIINSGIERVVCHRAIMERTPDRWMDTILAAQEMFEEAGVIYEWYDGEIGGCEILFDGEVWHP